MKKALLTLAVLAAFVLTALFLFHAANPPPIAVPDGPTLIAGFGPKTRWRGTTPAARRSRAVTPAPAFLAAAPQFKPGDRLAVPLLDGTVYEAEVIRTGRDVNGAVGMTARIAGTKHGRAFISSHDGKMLAHVTVPEHGRNYFIRYNAESDVHEMAEIDRDRSVILEAGRRLIPAAAGSSPTASGDAVAGASDSQPATAGDVATNVIVDVMIVYTTAANTYADGHGGIANVINLSMQKANDAHANSATGITLNLVHSALVSYTEGDALTDLDRLTFHDGFGAGIDQTYLEDVPHWRDTYGADLICMFESRSDIGGLGWALESSAGAPNYAHCLVRIEQATWTYTLPHEWGHTMGAGHSKTQYTQQGPQIWSYSAGWQWEDGSSGASTGYCSVMTYENFDGTGGAEYIRVGHFSDPNIDYNGNPTGDADNGDNARTLRQIREVIADYRALNHPPTLEVNNELSIAVNTTGTITNAYLDSSDADDYGSDPDDAASRTYTVTDDVDYGQLFNDANSNNTRDAGEEIDMNDSFTQQDVDSGLIKYNPNTDYAGADSFAFHLQDDSGDGPTDQFSIAVNGTPGVSVSSISGNTTEAGGTATFSVWLNSQPTGDVTIGLSSSDTSEGTVSPDSVTFTTSNWGESQTITVTGEDDPDDDGDVEYTVVTGTPTTSDSNYSALDPDDVSVTNIDDDTPQIVVSTPAVDIDEGNTATFEFHLDIVPLNAVTVNVSRQSGDSDIAVSGTSSFVVSDTSPQTVTLVAAEDNDNVLNGSAVIRCSAAGLDSVDVTANEVDDDFLLLVGAGPGGRAEGGGVADPDAGPYTIEAAPDAGYVFVNWTGNNAAAVANTGNATTTINVSAQAMVVANFVQDSSLPDILTNTAAVTIGEGTTNSFSVQLATAPLINTTVTVSVYRGDSDITVTGGSTLTFTPGNYSDPQPVTLSAATDADAVNGVALVRCSSPDANDAMVTVREDEGAGLAVQTNADTLNVAEGGSNTITVTLSGDPGGTVNLSCTDLSGDGDLSFTPENFTLDSGNY